MPEIFEKLGLDPKLLVAQAVNFVLLLIILQKIGYKPILKMLNDRTEKIEKSLKQAKKIEEELQNTEMTKVAEIKKAKLESQKILVEANELAEKRSQAMIEKTKEKTKEIVTNAKQEIQVEKESSIAEAKKEIADISIQIAKKIIGNNINEKEEKEDANEILAKIK